MASMIYCEICRITSSETGELIEVKRGLQKLIECSRALNDNLFMDSDASRIIYVHESCRKQYTRPTSVRSILSAMEVQDSPPAHVDLNIPRLRSSLEPFNFRRDCLFCGEENRNELDSRNSKRFKSGVRSVETKEIKQKIKDRALERGDALGEIVHARVESVLCLIAAEATYHINCYKSFFLPTSAQQGRSSGRPVDEARESAFNNLCHFLDENDECQYSICELTEHMQTWMESEQIFTSKYLKLKLKNHYGDRIVITSIPGQNSIVSFRDTVGKILHRNWYNERLLNEDDERMRIVQAAAAIVREDIRCQIYDYKSYSIDDSLEKSEELVPPTLKTFIDGVVGKNQNKSTNKKCSAIAQSIISATRPRSFISPILLGLSVYIHRHYGSRQMTDVLSSLGFSASYTESQRFEHSLLATEPQRPTTDAFLQFVFDNADYNIKTLDGHDTFHSMDGIQCVTPAECLPTSKCIPRLQHLPSAKLVAADRKIAIRSYRKSNMGGLNLIVINDVLECASLDKNIVDKFLAQDALWLSGYWIKEPPNPSWSGYMELSCASYSYDISRVVILPFINLDPGNLDTIYTALSFASEECIKQKQHTCIVTFDQPLYIKACEMIAGSSDLQNIVVRLGGFHLLMSFLGAVGHIMSGSGITDLWETVYAKASVTHMVTGHAYSRALRAHFLTQICLATLLFDQTNLFSDDMKDQLRNMYTDSLSTEKESEDTVNNDIINKLTTSLDVSRVAAETDSRTQKLWMQYFEQVNIMRLYVRAERSGNWELHLYSVRRMLPHLHAAGHLPYAKCAQLYYQQMNELKNVMCADEFNKFTQRGFFTVRRSKKFWSGIWSDMTIEQVLMRALKTTGGMTRGRGITDGTLARWVLALPGSIALCESLEQFCGVASSSSEQHVELRESRQKRDARDIKTFHDWFQSHSPFATNKSFNLWSLSTGVVASDEVNCDDAVRIGEKCMSKMIGHNFGNVKLRRLDKVVNMASDFNSIKVGKKNIEVNPQQLFNRIACVLESSDELEECMRYELAPRPPCLFDDVSMRKTIKSSLANALKDIVPCDQSTTNTTFVIDGGFLLHRVVWPKHMIFAEICRLYVDYVIKHYGLSSTVVFDGYDESLSTKCEEQKRRSAKSHCADIDFDLNMISTTTQQQFLTNSRNKSRLIQYLKNLFQLSNIAVTLANSDADTTIVSTALELSDSGKEVVVVGNDTDVLILLISLSKRGCNVHMLMPGTSKAVDQVFVIDKLIDSLSWKKDFLLFLHAISGCDTTSAIYGKGKKTVFKLLDSHRDLCTTIQTFYKDKASFDEISESGEAFLLKLYGDDVCSTLDELRYYTYKKVIARQSITSTFDLATIPPTSAAARQHSYRVYLQIHQWLGKDIDPCDWGWRQVNGALVPVTTLLPVAPESILNIISCNCKSGCNRRCKCKTTGMRCSAMCSTCRGIGCENEQICIDSICKDDSDGDNDDDDNNQDLVF